MGCSCLRSNLVIKSKVSPSQGLGRESSNERQRNINNGDVNHGTSNARLNNSRRGLLGAPEPAGVDLGIAFSNRQSPSNYNHNNEDYIMYSNSKNNPNFNYPEMKNEYAGVGLKKMKGYICPVDNMELQKVRENFWTSRTEGDQKVWEILRSLCDDKDIQDTDIKAILDGAGIKVRYNCINQVFDEKGEYYEIPNYCINDPLNYQIAEIEYDKERPKEEKIQFKIRVASNEKIINESNYITIKKLKEILISDKEFCGTENIKCLRLFFGGKELHDDKEVWFYNIENDSKIILLVKYIPKAESEKEITEDINQDHQHLDKVDTATAAKDLGFVKIKKHKQKEGTSNDIYKEESLE